MLQSLLPLAMACNGGGGGGRGHGESPLNTLRKSDILANVTSAEAECLGGGAHGMEGDPDNMVVGSLSMGMGRHFRHRSSSGAGGSSEKNSARMRRLSSTDRMPAASTSSSNAFLHVEARSASLTSVGSSLAPRASPVSPSRLGAVAITRRGGSDTLSLGLANMGNGGIITAGERSQIVARGPHSLGWKPSSAAGIAAAAHGALLLAPRSAGWQPRSGGVSGALAFPSHSVSTVGTGGSADQQVRQRHLHLSVFIKQNECVSVSQGVPAYLACVSAGLSLPPMIRPSLLCLCSMSAVVQVVGSLGSLVQDGMQTLGSPPGEPASPSNATGSSVHPTFFIEVPRDLSPHSPSRMHSALVPHPPELIGRHLSGDRSTPRLKQASPVRLRTSGRSSVAVQDDPLSGIQEEVEIVPWGEERLTGQPWEEEEEEGAEPVAPCWHEIVAKLTTNPFTGGYEAMACDQPTPCK